MVMYRCQDCGHLFEEGEQKNYEENRGEFCGAQCTETIQGCPICLGGFRHVNPCIICGSYDHDTTNSYCEECKNKILTKFQNFVNNNFSKNERFVLNELYEGEPI